MLFVLFARIDFVDLFYRFYVFDLVAAVNETCVRCYFLLCYPADMSSKNCNDL